MKTDTQEKQLGLPSFRRIIKLPAAIGDWTTLRAPQSQPKKIKHGLSGFDRLAEEELNTAHTLHYYFFQNLVKKLSRLLNIHIQLYAIEASQLSYAEYLKIDVKPIVQFNLATKEIGNISLNLDLELADAIINHSLAESDSKSILRGLTEAEEEVLLVCIKEVLAELPLAFSRTFEIAETSIIGSPALSMDPTLNPADTFVVFMGEISLKGRTRARMALGYLYSTLRILLSRIKNQKPKTDLSFHKLPPALLDKIWLKARSELGHTAITTLELNALESGDVVVLDSNLTNPAGLIISDKIHLPVKVGLKNGKYALKIIKEKESVPGSRTEKIMVEAPKITPLETEVKPETTPKIEDSIFDEEFAEEDFEDESLDEDFSEDEFEENEEV